MTLPVLTGYAFLGIAFGILVNRSGLSIVWTFALSAIVFAGALQFASVGLLIGVFNPLAAFTLAVLVNVRHLFYGISMLERFKGLGKKKPMVIYMMADEAFSINSAAQIPTSIDSSWFYFWTSLLCYLYWSLFSLLGHGLGFWIPSSIVGFDFVLTALFYILFLNQWEHPAHRRYLSLGLGATLVSLWILGKSQFLLGSMVLILVGLFWMKPKGASHD